MKTLVDSENLRIDSEMRNRNYLPIAEPASRRSTKTLHHKRISANDENEPYYELCGPIRCATVGSQPTEGHSWLRLGLNEYTPQGSYKPETKV